MRETNKRVTAFLDGLQHPLRADIELLRHIILQAVEGLQEDIKWNGPNYSLLGEDRITMKIHPPKQIQLIFHRGARKQEPPPHRLIDSKATGLVWKENDRAVLSFQHTADIEKGAIELTAIIQQWVEAAR